MSGRKKVGLPIFIETLGTEQLVFANSYPASSQVDKVIRGSFTVASIPFSVPVDRVRLAAARPNHQPVKTNSSPPGAHLPSSYPE